MHQRIFKQLLSLFLVLILLTIIGLQWAAVKKEPIVKEAIQMETEHYRFEQPKYTENPSKPHIEIKIY